MRCLIGKDFIDDAELEEEGAAEMLMDENSLASAPRPGTSFKRPSTSQSGRMTASSARRPSTRDGRPLTGFVRPGTSSTGRPATGSMSIEGAMQGSRPGTSRPITSSGRFIRLGTASMRQDPSHAFINVKVRCARW